MFLCADLKNIVFYMLHQYYTLYRNPFNGCIDSYRRVFTSLYYLYHHDHHLDRGRSDLPWSFCPGVICTAKPKSVSLMLILSSRRMFSGFRSLCTMFWEWRNWTTSNKERMIFLQKYKTETRQKNKTLYSHYHKMISLDSPVILFISCVSL